MTALDPADTFLEAARQRDPERYASLADRYPTNSGYDEYRIRIGEPPKRKRNRDGLLGAPRKRRFSDEEWAEIQAAREAGLREWELDYAFAKELAQQGM